jgi:hypothetical protein
MRPAAIFRLMAVGLAAALVVSVGTPVARADANSDCVEQCIDQWEQDKLACEEQLAQTLADLDQQAAECVEQYPDPDQLIQLGQCLQTVNILRAQAARDYRECISLANTVAYNCYRDCQQSPSAP